MSGIKSGEPKKSSGNLIEELRQKQEAKKVSAPPVVAVPQAKKVPVVPPLQGAPLGKQPVKRPLPAITKKQPAPPSAVPKRNPVAVSAPKQHRPLPVPQGQVFSEYQDYKADQGSPKANIEAGLDFYDAGDLIKAAYHYKLALDEGVSYNAIPVTHTALRNAYCDSKYIELYARIGSLYGTGFVGKRDLNQCFHFCSVAMRRTVLESNWEFLPESLRQKLITHVHYPDILKLLLERDESKQETMMSGFNLFLLLCEKLDIDIESEKKRDVEFLRAWTYFQKIEEEGNAQAQYEKGLSFLKEENFVQAAHHFKLALDKDYPEAIEVISHYRELQARMAFLYATGQVGEKSFSESRSYYNLVIKGTILEECAGKMPWVVYNQFINSVDFYELFNVLIDKADDGMLPEQLLMFLSERLSLDLEQERNREILIRNAIDAVDDADLIKGGMKQVGEAEALLHALAAEEPHPRIDSFLSSRGPAELDGRPYSDIQRIALHAKRALDNGYLRNDFSMRPGRGFDEYQSLLLEIGSLYAKGVGEKSLQKAFRYFNEALIGGPSSKIWLILPYDLKVRVMQTFTLSETYLLLSRTNPDNVVFELMLYMLQHAGVDLNDPQYEWVQGFNLKIHLGRSANYIV